MFKNVTLLKEKKDGKVTWRLLGPDGVPLDSFTVFADSLMRKHGLNTRASYCRHLAAFYDYIFEADAVFRANHPDEPFTRAKLKDILEAYDEYLVYGKDASSEIAKSVSQSKPSTLYSANTSALMHTSLRKFLSLSEYVQQELKEASLLNMASVANVDSTAVFPEINSKTPVSPSQRRAMTANSIIAGVISGGPMLLKSTVLPTRSIQISYEESRAFPFDQIEAFINAQRSFRDKTLYALLAASGCRNHEGLQLLFDDIDVGAGTVTLVNPALRANHPSYLYLTPSERELLAWKGRTTDSTLLIEPFASIFFENLQQYLAREYIPHGLHRFIFQYLNKGQEGRPYFLSAHSSRQESFKRAASAVGLEKMVSGPHSLRHAYGSYLLNYFPRINGEYGLPITFVQQLMGHSEQKSTLRYARYDKDLIALELRHANAMVYNGAAHKSIVELKLEALNSQVRKLKERIGLPNA